MKEVFAGMFLVGLFGYLTTRLWQEFVGVYREWSAGR